MGSLCAPQKRERGVRMEREDCRCKGVIPGEEELRSTGAQMWRRWERERKEYEGKLSERSGYSSSLLSRGHPPGGSLLASRGAFKTLVGLEAELSPWEGSSNAKYWLSTQPRGCKADQLPWTSDELQKTVGEKLNQILKASTKQGLPSHSKGFKD